jgi:SAM-dependent methyltransferase
VDVRCLRGDISELIGRHPEWAFDLVLCAEVLYMGPEPQALLGRLAGVVRPGGLLCVSHRPQAYYLLEALRRGAFEAAVFISRHQEGPLSYYEPGYYNWQTGPQLQDMYASLGLTIRDAFPVDRFAWLSGLDPARLTDQQREELLALERSTPLQDPLCARYIGVIAQRAGDG